MRTIKCRAWHYAEKKMCDVKVMTLGQGAYLIGIEPGADQIFNDGKLVLRHPGDGRFCNEGEYDLLLSTYLLDKNSVEIYEGDIVIAGNGKNYDIKFGAFTTPEDDDYCMSALGFYFNSDKKKHEPFGVSAAGGSFCYEVIGNIFENTDLLTK